MSMMSIEMINLYILVEKNALCNCVISYYTDYIFPVVRIYQYR